MTKSEKNVDSDIRNEALRDQLDQARQQAEALNIQLSAETQRRRQAEQQLHDSHRQEQERLAATVFEATSDGIFILDPQQRVLAVNQAFSVITGYRARDMVGRALPSRRKDADTPDTHALLQTALLSQDRWEGELIEERRSGERYPQWLQLTVVRNDSGEITHYVGFFTDRTVSRQTEEQLRYLTEHDPLTHLGNRSLFTRKLNEAIGHARTHGHSLAVLHIDLDRFKNINDTLGHEQADALLRKMADRLKALLPNAFILARLGADEFAVVKQNMSRQALTELARKLLQKLDEPVQIGGTELIMSASIGVSQFPAEAGNSLQLVNQASQAMQHAKYLGGNCFQFYSVDLPARNTDHLQLENELRKAIADDQLQIYYQPKLHLASGTIGGAEALVRWQHPTHGMLLPGKFITVAEESGLILPLGEQVLRRACEQARQWLNDGLPVRVAVNMSVQQLRQPHLAIQVENILQTTGLPASLLELELTESMLLEHSDTVENNIAALQALGVELAVDDFGTGYSSLAYLRRFPIHSLKIDRAFICELDEQPRDAAIVRAIIAMAHSMNLRVVAEGVEQESQLSFLRNQGCDEVQGFLISKPVPAEAFTRLLQQQTRACL